MDTPNTMSYMLAGYIIFSVTFFGYLVYLWLRWKLLLSDEEDLQKFETKE
ncbi:MAG: hypothetical protein RBS68_05630 [Anaerolineales bacterium]|jgi:hypothetical protein|nr:hypothetical protein [Anaerolineales bacterium]